MSLQLIPISCISIPEDVWWRQDGNKKLNKHLILEIISKRQVILRETITKQEMCKVYSCYFVWQSLLGERNIKKEENIDLEIFIDNIEKIQNRDYTTQLNKTQQKMLNMYRAYTFVYTQTHQTQEFENIYYKFKQINT